MEEAAPRRRLFCFVTGNSCSGKPVADRESPLQVPGGLENMLCDEARRIAYFFLDGSLNDNRQHDLETHISICPDCETRVGIHRRFRLFIARRLRPDSAPARFKQRLSRALRALAT
jgi:mycothiol system anti-sigma-R factor